MAAAPPPDEARAGLRAGAAVAPASTGVASGTHIVTAKRLPSTSTVVDRSTSGAASSSDGGALAGAFSASTPVRSSDSSTHFVECVAAWKSGWRRMARSAGMVVATPSTTISSRALTARAMATGRSRPHTTSLPIRLS